MLVFLRAEACNFIKRDSNTGVFLRILQFFWEHLLYLFLRVSRSDYLSENTFKRLFKSNFVQFNHFNCLLLFKDTKIQSSNLLFKIRLYFLYILVSYWFSRFYLLWYPLVLNLESYYASKCPTKEAVLWKEPPRTTPLSRSIRQHKLSRYYCSIIFNWTSWLLIINYFNLSLTLNFLLQKNRFSKNIVFCRRNIFSFR